MKQFFSLLTVFLSGLLLKANAQCTVSNPVISNVSYVQGATCTITFDIEFDLTSNGGNKYVGMYVYTGTLPSSFYGGVGGNDVPTTATINASSNVLATLQINTDISTTVTSANYTAKTSSGNPTSFKPSRPFTKSATGVTDKSRFKISGLTVTVPSCVGGPVDLKLDVGSTNAASFNNYQCLIQGLPFRANDPILNGQIQCATPRSFTFSINTTTATTVTFSAYADAARTILLQAPSGFTYSGYGAIAPPMAISSYNNITLTVAANSNTSFGPFRYQAANGTANPVYLSLSLASNTQNSNSLQIDNGCALLPVSLSSFQAIRDKQTVNISWETSTESNSKGFEVERRTTGNWATVATVASKALNGYSSSALSYQVSDVNTQNGISQYRIKQVDVDGRIKHSDIKTVKGLGQNANITIYPNPAAGGRFSVMLNNDEAHTVQIVDGTGRAVQQFNSVKGVITVSGLKPGTYLIVSENNQSGLRATQKVMMQ